MKIYPKKHRKCQKKAGHRLQRPAEANKTKFLYIQFVEITGNKFFNLLVTDLIF